MNYVLTDSKSNKRIKWLASQTSDDWIEMATCYPMEILIDHAHCERKAAGAAIQLMFRYMCEPGLAEALSPVAREELEHFELVLDLIKSRGRYLEPLPAPPYGNFLSKQIRKVEPKRMLDGFLVAGLIEARSHERMSLIAINSSDKEIRDLYHTLLASEARHFGLYLKLAEQRFNREEIISRLKELASVEAEILSTLHPEPRMHS
tara:strand:+ start:205 stop:819 length:615 start_codon:yes stop_codon:yes gene_type:complete